jgi:hypothetical protein
MALMLEQQMLHPSPPVQDDAVQERCVPLRVRDHFLG